MSDRSAKRSTSTQRPQMRGPRGFRNVEKAKNVRQAFQRLTHYLRPFLSRLGVVFLIVFIQTILGLLGPYFLGVAIDKYILPGDIPGLGRIALLMLGVYLAGVVLQAVSGYLMASISQEILQNLRISNK